MDNLKYSHRRNVDAETLNHLLSTDMMVRMKPTEYSSRQAWMDAGVASIRSEPERSHLGLRVVPGNASNEGRHCGNRPARNPSPVELSEEIENGDARVYVPIQWVIGALEADSLDDFVGDSYLSD